MDITEVIRASATVGGLLLAALLLVTAVSLIVQKSRGRPWRERYPHLGRYFAVRLGLAFGAAIATFALIAAGLVLNSHRPPADKTPAIKVARGSGPVKVTLTMDDCSSPIQGRLTVVRPKADRATIYTDQDGVQTIDLKDGTGRFVLSDPTAKRGLLSCYLQLPVVKHSSGASRVELKLDGEMEIDTVASVPAPGGYLNGRWVWSCPGGEQCPALATASYAIEDGSKQVIVLVLAALLGSIIALFIGEALIEPIRRKLRGQNDPS